MQQPVEVVDATAWAIQRIPDADWPGAKEDVRLRADWLKLSPTSLATVSFLLARIDRTTGKSHWSAKGIAEKIDREERGVRRAFHDLAKRGLIQRCRTQGDRRWANRVWVTTIPALVEAASARERARIDRTNKSDGPDKKCPRPDKIIPVGPDNGVRQILRLDTDSNSPPPSPTDASRERGKKASRVDELVEQLRADGKHLHVVEHLVVPLLSSLTVQHDDPLALLRAIRDHRSIIAFPRAVLDRLGVRLKETRKKLVAVKDVVEAINDVTKGLPMFRIFDGDPSWSAWLDDLEKQGLSAAAKICRQQGQMLRWTRWPEWHPEYRPELENGLPA